ncbi:MAG: hypothetical protein ACR2GD_00590 [Pyrinomonadaceae bacterium]
MLGQTKESEALEAAANSLELSQKAENRETTGEAWRVLALISAKLKQEIIINNMPLNASECFSKALQIFSEIKMEAALAPALFAALPVTKTNREIHNRLTKC